MQSTQPCVQLVLKLDKTQKKTGGVISLIDSAGIARTVVFIAE
jgi:hypothetical protein